MLIQQLSPDAYQDSDGPHQREIEAFLTGFAARYTQFKAVYQAYLAETIELGEVTRALSEATADAEMAFSAHSHGMTMEQLQQFASLQKAFDTMMEQIFQEEIRRNYRVCAQAIENGEYFLIGLTHKGIQSAIHMLHSKDRIKTEKERKLEAVEQEQTQVQAMLKVIKALQQALDTEMDVPALRRIEKVLGLYVTYFRELTRTQLLSACDRRVLTLLRTHFQTLLATSSGPFTYDHLARCLKPLQELPAGEVLEPLLSECRQLAGNPQAHHAA